MKDKDIILIIVVVFVSGIFSITISSYLFSTSRHQTTVEEVEQISPTFQNPDPKYFNSKSIDPTQLIQIGPGSNTAPFNGPAN